MNSRIRVNTWVILMSVHGRKCKKMTNLTRQIGPGQQNNRADWSWLAEHQSKLVQVSRTSEQIGPDQQNIRADRSLSAECQGRLFLVCRLTTCNWSRSAEHQSTLVLVSRTTEHIHSGQQYDRADWSWSAGWQSRLVLVSRMALSRLVLVSRRTIHECMTNRTTEQIGPGQQDNSMQIYFGQQDFGADRYRSSGPRSRSILSAGQ